MMRRSGTYAGRLARVLLCAGLGGALVGCVLDLDPLVSCGDGYVDAVAGEDCDPAADDNAKPCNPATCRFAEATCGNGTIDPGEACDTTDFANKDCPSGKGYLSCTAQCTLDETTCVACGNGKLDPGEECDPSFVSDDFTPPTECSSLTNYPLKPYTTGVVTACTSACKWYRGPCGYCGDDEADPPTRVDLYFPEDKSEAEWCDGDDIPSQNLEDYCNANCPQAGLQCTAKCLKDCSAFDISQISSEQLKCCVARGDECPADGAPCCYAYAHDLPEDQLFDPDLACEEKKVISGEIHVVCR